MLEDVAVRPSLPMKDGMSIRVLIVDDNADVRMLLRIGIDLRPGMEIVGEAEHGLEALELAASTQPDIVILDREMPIADGLTVLPALRERCPGSLIVLYTAAANDDVHRAAAGGGADAVRTKGGQAVDALVDELEELLLGTGEPDLVRLRVGPVDGTAARLWVSNTRRILDALLQAPHEIPASVPGDLLSVFRDILEEWSLVADGEETFYWSAAARISTIEGLVLAWADLDRLDDETLQRLGCHWSPPGAHSFFEALTTGVVVALRRHDELKGVVRQLPEDWSTGEPVTAPAGASRS
jgi:DNA-binding NarL/FixJ family response regulator